jgi:Tol biopolymer transport system component
VVTDKIFSRINISPDGKKVIYSTGEMREELWRIPFAQLNENPWQDAQLLTTHTTFTTNMDIAPDGQTIALETSLDGIRKLALYSLAAGTQQIIYGEQNAFAPSWSPDGKWLAFDAGGGNKADIWRIPAAGGPAQKFIESPGADWMPTYSPDGSAICFLSNRGGQFDLWVLSLGDKQAEQITNTPASESGGYWSHDGKRLAYFRTSDSENNTGVWLFDIVNQTEQEIYRFPERKIDILTTIVWHPNNSAIYFFDGVGFAQILLQNRELSYPLQREGAPVKHIRYDVSQNDLFLINRKYFSTRIWMAEGLE